MPKLLIVDDEAATVDMLSTYLTLQGHETVGAYSGEDGLVLVQVEKPDLLILDLMMPDIEGFEVCQRLRQNPEFQTLPVLIVSARTDQGSIDKAMSYGADGYLTKPINLPRLTSEIQRLLTQPVPVHGNGTDNGAAESDSETAASSEETSPSPATAEEPAASSPADEAPPSAPASTAASGPMEPPSASKPAPPSENGPPESPPAPDQKSPDADDPPRPTPDST